HTSMVAGCRIRGSTTCHTDRCLCFAIPTTSSSNFSFASTLADGSTRQICRTVPLTFCRGDASGVVSATRSVCLQSRRKRRVVLAVPPTNTDTARAFLEAAFRNDRDVGRQLIADGYRYIDRTRGDVALTPEQLQQTASEYHGAWSDQDLDIEHIMETTDGTVIAQYRLTAPHTG